MRRVALALAAVVLLVRPAPVAADPAGPPGTVAYVPPVSAAVVDPYRPPPQPWDPGNRGIDYATSPGAPVAAAADGEVVFAGQVGGALHVVILHPDGIRTSYSLLQSITVHRGDRVSQGQAVGTSGDDLHFGARAGDDYIDPATLFGDGLPEVHLVPDEERHPGTEEHERAGLLKSLTGWGSKVAGATADGVAWARDQAATAASMGADVLKAQWTGFTEGLRLLDAWRQDLSLWRLATEVDQVVADYQEQRHHCTAPGAPPPHLTQRHIAVEVGGLWSSSAGASITEVKTAPTSAGGLGYADADVVRLSYAGGTVKPSAYSGASPYSGATTVQDITVSARRLRQLLEEVARKNPGVPVDILAHSEGGIVARQALALESDPGDRALPPINSVVLLGVPNQGADLASAEVLLGTSSGGAAVQQGESLLLRNNPLDGPAQHQLAQSSTFLARLNDTPLPPGVHVTSIGARMDPVVPARRTRLPGADNVVIDSGGGAATHSHLPGSDEAWREIDLAVNGMPPTCQSLPDMLLDELTSRIITTGEDAAGTGLWLAGQWIDHRMPWPGVPIKTEEVP
ncbi:MAG: peptidoglycan DD-metalloendopeptidase family protein [Acidimicrobiales bacterium]